MESDLEIRHNSVRPTSNKWSIFNKKLPKSEVIYFTQVSLIYIVSIACVINLSISSGNLYIWSNLLCACIGYMIPAPSIKNKNKYINNESTIFPNTP